MNYDAPELRDRLAAEYVLGTLHGRARDRFERVLLADDRARADVERWERQLNDLALELPERAPPRRVWRRIERRIRPAPAPERRAWAWPLAALASTATAVVLAAYILLMPPAPDDPSGLGAPNYVALVGTGDDGPRWAVATHIEPGMMMVRTLRPASPDPEHDHELWLVPGQGDPISLGVLPDQGRARHNMPANAVAQAGPGVNVAVSVEPPGGSPTGAPTGEIVFQGEFIPL
ncbi:MAG: anti-sigma factor [Halofilum sp. (in: g-proteobacteria)]